MFIVDSSKILRWAKHYCGLPGCSCESCVCAVCARPIGAPEEDPRHADHDEFCAGCELCEVPIILFREHGELAAMHPACFTGILQTRLSEEHF
jgi:hypothetical protein